MDMWLDMNKTFIEFENDLNETLIEFENDRNETSNESKGEYVPRPMYGFENDRYDYDYVFEVYGNTYEEQPKGKHYTYHQNNHFNDPQYNHYISTEIDP